MNDLIQRITNAIFRQEGMPLDFHNPGNLRDCPWFAKDPVGRRIYPVQGVQPREKVQYSKSGFWIPRSRLEGVAGAAHVVALHIAEGDSLRKLIGIWAPPNENDTETYIKDVKLWAAIPDENQPLWNFLGEEQIS